VRDGEGKGETERER
jgi:hypothetical protein